MYKITPAAYIFTHQYLNTMQQGIQSLHVIGEFIVSHRTQVDDWAKNHKTVRILNAGSGQSFDIAYQNCKLYAKKYKLAFASFQEPDINNMTTAFGIIVTPKIVAKVDDYVLMAGENEIDTHPLVSFLKDFPSAR